MPRALEVIPAISLREKIGQDSFNRRRDKPYSAPTKYDSEEEIPYRENRTEELTRNLKFYEAQK